MRLTGTRRQLYLLSQCALLGAALAAAVLSSRPADWHPIGLVLLLFALAVASERLTVTVGSATLSASFIALVLAMTLLGPAPAVAIGLTAIVLESIIRRPPLPLWLNDAASYAVYLIVGGLLARLAFPDVHSHHGQSDARGILFAFTVFGVFLVANVLNFALIAVNKRVVNGRGLIDQVRFLLVPMLPGQFAAAALAALLAIAYTNFGYPVLAGLVLVIVIFQLLALALVRSEDRAEQLQARSSQLAHLQLGVLVTLVETLALRDPMTARHAAAVARYSRALAREVGCTEREQDLVHTAGLLHDIGKFALPDRILKADRLTDDELAQVRRHPQEGATLVGRLDGYGPVSEIILYHHERMDGAGYPAGLIGSEIPRLSRVLAVANVYDVLTARDSYRTPMPPVDAITELRAVAGRQLDSDLVEAFAALLERDGPVSFAAGDEANFESELAFELRARELAQPR